MPLEKAALFMRLKMRKAVTMIIIVILSISTVVFGTYSVAHYYFNYKSSSWFSQDICNSNYTIIAKEIGTPFWDGNSEALVTIKDNKKGKFVTSFSFEIDNEGAELSERNYSIEESSEYVKLSFFDKDGSMSSVYRFYYLDFCV